MKKLCFFIVALLGQLAVAQNVTLEQLQKIMNMKDLGAADVYLQNAGWGFSGSGYNYVEYGYKMNYDRQKAQGWLRVEGSEHIDYLRYQLFNQETFIQLRNAASSKGWKMVSNTAKPGSTIFRYENNGMYFEFEQQIDNDEDWSDREFVRYICSVTRKGTSRDELNGEKTQYDEEDDTWTYYNLVDGVMQGMYAVSQKDPSTDEYMPYIVGNMKDDKLEGELQIFSKKGLLWKTVMLTQGVQNGLETDYVYDEEGNLVGMQVQNYVNDELEGESYYADAEGTKFFVQNYKNGERHGRYMYFIDNKSLVVGNYVADEVDGWQTIYKFSDGLGGVAEDWFRHLLTEDYAEDPDFYSKKTQMLLDTVNVLRVSSRLKYSMGRVVRVKSYLYDGNKTYMSVFNHLDENGDVDGPTKTYEGIVEDDQYLYEYGNYSHGKREGESMWHDGFFTYYAMYSNDELHGLEKQYVLGEHFKTSTYNHGVLEHEIYYQNGAPEITVQYADGEWSQIERVFADGTIRFIHDRNTYEMIRVLDQYTEHFITADEDVKRGVDFSYTIASEEDLIDRFKQDCYYTKTASTGEVMEEGLFRAEKECGVWKYYLQDEKGGTVVCEAYRDSYPVLESFRKNGELFSGKVRFDGTSQYEIISVKNGLRHGKTEIYNTSGLLLSTEKYSKGEKK